MSNDIIYFMFQLLYTWAPFILAIISQPVLIVWYNVIIKKLKCAWINVKHANKTYIVIARRSCELRTCVKRGVPVRKWFAMDAHKMALVS